MFLIADATVPLLFGEIHEKRRLDLLRENRERTFVLSGQGNTLFVFFTTSGHAIVAANPEAGCASPSEFRPGGGGHPWRIPWFLSATDSSVPLARNAIRSFGSSGEFPFHNFGRVTTCMLHPSQNDAPGSQGRLPKYSLIHLPGLYLLLDVMTSMVSTHRSSGDFPINR